LRSFQSNDPEYGSTLSTNEKNLHGSLMAPFKFRLTSSSARLVLCMIFWVADRSRSPRKSLSDWLHNGLELSGRGMTNRCHLFPLLSYNLVIKSRCIPGPFQRMVIQIYTIRNCLLLLLFGSHQYDPQYGMFAFRVPTLY